MPAHPFVEVEYDKAAMKMLLDKARKLVIAYAEKPMYLKVLTWLLFAYHAQSLKSLFASRTADALFKLGIVSLDSEVPKDKIKAQLDHINLIEKRFYNCFK